MHKSNDKKTLRLSVSLAVISMLFAPGFSSNQSSQQESGNTDQCSQWHARVDSSIKLSGKKKSRSSDEPILKELQKKTLKEFRNEKRVIEGIACLLQLEGNKKESSTSGATSYSTTEPFGKPTIEVAALYYISYMYYEKWDHGEAAQLVNDKGVVKDDATIHKAYEAYRVWFNEVKLLGLNKAREEGLNPLKGTGINWYGNAIR